MKPTWVLSDDEKKQRTLRKKVNSAAGKSNAMLQDTTQPIFEQQSKYSFFHFDLLILLL